MKDLSGKNIVEFEGVLVEKTGDILYRHRGHLIDSWGRSRDMGYDLIPNYNIYDKDGNWFYRNCRSLEEAQKTVERLLIEGKKAIIGHRAPIRGRNGILVPNPDENVVAVYLVEELEETMEIQEFVTRKLVHNGTKNRRPGKGHRNH